MRKPEPETNEARGGVPLQRLVRLGLAVHIVGDDRVKLADGLWMSGTCDEFWIAVHDGEYDAMKGYACQIETREQAVRLRDALNAVLSETNK